MNPIPRSPFSPSISLALAALAPPEPESGPPPLVPEPVTIGRFGDLVYRDPDLAPAITPEAIGKLATWAARQPDPELAGLDVRDPDGRGVVAGAFMAAQAAQAVAGGRWMAGGSILSRGGQPWGYEARPRRLTRRDVLEISLLIALVGFQDMRERTPDGGHRVLLALPGAGHPELDAIDAIMAEARLREWPDAAP